jgi:hypothetical protein
MALTDIDAGRLADNVFNNVGPFKNRIINGDMRIDQRNAGASVTPTNAGYNLDRWTFYLSQASKITAQRDTVVPTGFTNSMKLTVSAAVTPGAADFFAVAQKIEGFNAGDLGFGTASAKTTTLSFWVRSSVTGTYAVRLCNSAFNRSYVATYTVSAVDTWEQKSITIAGDTSGTWLSDSGIGINVQWDLGSGSNFNTTADAWQGSDVTRTSGSTSWVSTSGATFYLTGVQLEAGTVATPFERRSYGQELSLCQRYYAKTYAQGTVPGTVTNFGCISSTAATTHAYASAGTWQFPVTMRATPAIVLYSSVTANTVGKVVSDATDGTGQAITISDRNAFITRDNDSSGVIQNSYIRAHATASAEL